MSRHKLRFLPRYRNPSPSVGSDKRTEHRCAIMLCAAIPSLKEEPELVLSRGSYGQTMSAEMKIRRQAGMLIRRPGPGYRLWGTYLVFLSAIADFQDYTISIAAEARPIQGH